jgi:CheY-like chemotaxis protein
MKILFVDDNKAAREISKVYFERKGYQLDLAKSGEEAILKIINNDYDIVITDEQMPDGMSGIELAEWAEKNFPKIRIIYASAYWERALKIGKSFIKKPLTPEKLWEHLEARDCA